ncbi:hypothetical protein SAMN04488103_101695 [Gemmobacter aquatilis]|uniref:DUF1109 domain-containing protein n=1 Tax=Gemmobacter aquatilis TaxID=933059 RepID=A0A1H7ZYW7_9RHOB|nr:DUF1109 domain-containing protein [Gemmobacter aquatilis]SEM63473.1 hypothetical protein SAMN04488103_101695 [Gemmobacter aquatilis]
MRTEDLITRLATQAPPAPIRPARVVAVLLAVLAPPVLWFLWSMGMRPDLGPALLAPVTLLKSLIPATLSVASLALALNLARPEARAGLRLAPLWLATGAALALLGWAWAQTPADQMGAAIRGSTQAKCLISIVLFSILPLAAGLALLRRGASTRPALSGAMLGLASSAGAATAYALHCTEDNPLFFITWYGAAILGVTLAGALLGARLLRW